VHNTTDENTSTTLNPLHPQEIIREFTGTMWRILEELMFLETCRKKRAPGMSVYTTPSTSYLAGKCGCSRWTISRSTQRLVELGVIHKRFRRAINETFQTCLYQVSSKFRWRINRVGAAIKSVTSRVRKPAHKPANSSEISKPKVANAPKRGGSPPIWAALREKLRGGDSK
jgi:hypothetical protein